MFGIFSREKITLSLFVCFINLVLIWANSAAAQKCTPLLIPGKQTLFQKVISHPGANLYSSAQESSAVVQASVTPFTVFYVYERTSVNGTEWLKVGPSASCELSGWIKGEFVSDWRQSLTLVFTDRVGRKPVMFFSGLESLENVALPVSDEK